MIIFDVDLDFFFDKRIGPQATADHTRRTQWNQEIRQWLSLDRFMAHFQPAFHPEMEVHCVENHQQVLEIWGNLIKRGVLTPPFTIVHFDAHSDLYTGRREDGYYDHPDPTDVARNPACLNETAEEDNFLWWTVRLGWTDCIQWVKPQCAPLYYLGEKEFSARFQPDFARQEIMVIQDRLRTILAEEEVDHPLLLGPENRKTYKALQNTLLYLKYKDPFVCQRFGRTFTFSLHRLNQLSIGKCRVKHFCLAHSLKYVPEKADAVFAAFKAQSTRSIKQVSNETL